VSSIAAELGENAAEANDVPTSGVLGGAQWVLDRINAVMAVLSSLAIALAGCVLTWEVVGRYFLGIPSDWQDELSVFLLIGATFASAAWTQARRGHVAIDVMAHILPPGLERLRHVLADLAACLFCGYFTWKSWQLLMEAIEDDQISSTAWGPPMWIPYSAMMAGMALLSLQILLQLFAGVGQLRARR